MPVKPVKGGRGAYRAGGRAPAPCARCTGAPGQAKSRKKQPKKPRKAKKDKRKKRRRRAWGEGARCATCKKDTGAKAPCEPLAAEGRVPVIVIVSLAGRAGCGWRGGLRGPHWARLRL